MYKNERSIHIILYRRLVLDLGGPPTGPFNPGRLGLNWCRRDLTSSSLTCRPVKPFARADIASEAPPKMLLGGGMWTSVSTELRLRRLISGRRLTNGSVELRREIVTGLDRKYVLLSLFFANVRNASSMISSETPRSAQTVVMPAKTTEREEQNC